MQVRTAADPAEGNLTLPFSDVTMCVALVHGRAGSIYEEGFYARSTSFGKSSKDLLEIVLGFAKSSSIVDLGAGNGDWAMSAAALGVERLVRIDGAWVPEDIRNEGAGSFIACDLEGQLPDLGDFDMAMCLEVLEHVSPQAGKRAVDWLCARAPVVLFSAAIPGQGGTRHVNEQWQSHWAGEFDRHGFGAWDVIRPAVWHRDDIPFWYRQNMLLYVDRQRAPDYGLAPEAEATLLDVVHPELLAREEGKAKRYGARRLSARWKSFRGRFGRSR
jgi:hypothetical protein